MREQISNLLWKKSGFLWGNRRLRRWIFLAFLVVGGMVYFGFVPVSNSPASQPPATADLIIENHDNVSHVIHLTVRNEMDQAILNGTYRIPPKTGLRADHVIANVSGPQKYIITARIGPNQTASLDWSPYNCGDSAGPAGNTDAGIVIEESNVQIIQNQCDWRATGFHFETYQTAAKYRINTTAAEGI